MRVKNRFLENDHDGYVDVLVNLCIDGFIVEVQLTLKTLAELKTWMHPFYKLARSSGYEELCGKTRRPAAFLASG